MFFTRIVATFAREAKLFLLAKAASKNDFLRTIFIASDNGSVVDLPLFNVLSSGWRARLGHLRLRRRFLRKISRMLYRNFQPG
jgi:hypothetical protein